MMGFGWMELVKEQGQHWWCVWWGIREKARRFMLLEFRGGAAEDSKGAIYARIGKTLSQMLLESLDL